MLNFQKKGGIGWCTATWNVIAGCKHSCPYCYCNRLSKRFGKDFKKYEFREKYLKDLIKSKKIKDGDKIFVGSSGDMWGDWVPKDDIQQVLNICGLIKNRNLIFQFLTKNPKRYSEFDIPKNCLKGVSIDTTKRMYDYIENVNYLSAIDFISFEPLLEKIIDIHLINANFKNLEWIIIGANSNKGEPKPPDEWADKIIERARKYNIPVWVKDNYKYKEIIKQFPNE